MVILTIKTWVILISRTFLVTVYLLICNFPYFLTDKQKTKKMREIQNTQIFIVSSTYHHFLHFFCFGLSLVHFGAKFQMRHFQKTMHFTIFLERKIDWWHFTSPLLLLCKGSESQILIRTFFKGLCRHQRKWKHSGISGMHSPMEGGQHLLLFGPHQSAPREPLRLWGQVQVLCLFHHPPGIDPLL